MTDLSLVPMDEITAELDKRFDTVCLITDKVMREDMSDIHYHFKDKIGCLGLMRIADKAIKEDFEDLLEQDDKNETC